MTFQQDTEITPVIFRKWKKRDGGGVLALFPAQCGTNDLYTCGSFEHVGQHGSADPLGVMERTNKALPKEYEALKRELEDPPYGYRLKVYKRLQRGFLETRKEELRKFD